MTRYVYDFVEGNKDLKDLLGGKGANLAEMTRMGLPVPHGFTVTCEACNAYRAAGRRFPDGMLDEAAEHLRRLEERMGRRLVCWARSSTTCGWCRTRSVRPSATPGIRCCSRCAPAPSSPCRG